MPLPLSVHLRPPRAAAVAATLLLHLGVAFWLLAARPERPPLRVVELPLRWVPAPPPLPPPPMVEPPPATLEPIEPQPITLPQPLLQALPDQPAPDWHAAARDVAGAIGGGPGRRTFGEMPTAPPGRPKEVFPPSIYPKPLPRVGTTTTSPEGETVLWVSDNCYISLGSTSLTMRDFHAARLGVRRCQIGAGRRKPRDDLFEHLKRPEKPLPLPPPPAQQEPGCGPGTGKESCAP